jgi:hypothetical protein
MSYNREDINDVMKSYYLHPYTFDVTAPTQEELDEHVDKVMKLLEGKSDKKVSVYALENQSEEQDSKDDDLINRNTKKFFQKLKSYLKKHAPHVVIDSQDDYQIFLSTKKTVKQKLSSQQNKTKKQIVEILKEYQEKEFDFEVDSAEDEVEEQASSILDVLIGNSPTYVLRRRNMTNAPDKKQADILKYFTLYTFARLQVVCAQNAQDVNVKVRNREGALLDFVRKFEHGEEGG